MNNNFYCQKVCGEIGFSIDEWNETSTALDLTNIAEKEKNDILFPPQCEKQCFDCVAIIGDRRLKTQKLIQNP